jgi:hypothetical protein
MQVFAHLPKKKKKGKLQANPLTDPIAWTNVWPGVGVVKGGCKYAR